MSKEGSTSASMPPIRSRRVIELLDDIEIIAMNGNNKFEANYAYFEGDIKLSLSRTTMRASLISFRNKDYAFSCYKNLNLISSELIVKPISCGQGTHSYKDFGFLAIPKITCTFSEVLDNADKVFRYGRFSEPFIKIMRNIVEGVQFVHDLGFYCPDFRSTDVLIYHSSSNARAKIWKFELVGAEKEQEQVWIMLAGIIEDAAEKHLILSLEITDLVRKMRMENLTGLDILKQSALLSSQEKFDKVLDLNLYLLLRSPNQPTDPSKAQVLTDLDSFLVDDTKKWVCNTPQWMTQQNCYKRPNGDSGKDFVEGTRSLIEHGPEYIPPSANGEDMDLESEIRQAWPYHFLEVQNLACRLNL